MFDYSHLYASLSFPNFPVKIFFLVELSIIQLNTSSIYDFIISNVSTEWMAAGANLATTLATFLGFSYLMLYYIYFVISKIS